MAQFRRPDPVERPTKVRRRTHRSTMPIPDAFSSLPSYWPPGDDSYFDTQFYGAGPAIIGENVWFQGHGPGHTDQAIAKPLPMGTRSGFELFQPAPAEAPLSALSTASSITYSSPSIVSQPSSAEPGLSPTQTELPYEWPASKPLSSRDPSPTQRTIADQAESRFVCLGPHCNEAFDREKDLNSHVKAEHAHTCCWAGCEQPSFSSKDGLTWHVKLEHLLICPAPGCTESLFQSKRILECHLKCAHPVASKGKGKEIENVEPKPAAQAEADAVPNTRGIVGAVSMSSQRDALEERAIKQVLSVAVSKKKCREQLRAVVEKKYKRQNGHTPRGGDSPDNISRARSSRLIEAASFPIVWEHGVLPFLVEFVPKWCGPKHVISITRGKTPGSRRVCIMTNEKLSRARRIIIATHVRDLLPETHRAVSFVFSTGSVDRLRWARGLSKEMPDDICMARNPYYFKQPCMGDSIGIDGYDGFRESTSTLGPCLIVGGGSYWLANFHPFVEAYQHLAEVYVQHPSPSDRSRCADERHDTLPETDFTLGNLTATSGIDLKTTRISHDPYWEECDKELPLVVTDWILIASKTKTSDANLLRRFPSETMPLLKGAPVKNTSSVVPGATVVSTGRTSGQQRGQVCEIPAYVSAEENGTGKATREWFIEEPFPYDDEECWIRGGIGVEGDSGAAILDADTNALVGQLWGRNKYFGSGPRLAFFTPVDDIFDDIQERCDQQSRPQLPQYRDESECYPVYPSCRQCYDLRAYLDSRRSSRESLRSIMGRSDTEAGDLPSLGGTSELATPKDHALWAPRQAGMEEIGSSFTSNLSPAAAHPFCLTPQPGTPGIVDVKSPYALTLSDKDLYGDEGLSSTGVSGKRGAAAVPLMRSSAPNAKRRRVN